MKKEEKNNYANKENTNGAFVGIDEKYIPNNSTEKKDTYVKENKGTKRAANIYLIVFAILFILILGATIFGMVHVFSTMNKTEKDVKEDTSAILEKAKELINNDKEKIQNEVEENKEQAEEKVEDKTEDNDEETKTNNKTTTQESSNITQKELEEDAGKFQNGSDEDRQEVIDKYEDKAREELNKRGYDYDQMKEDAQKRVEELRQQYGY